MTIKVSAEDASLTAAIAAAKQKTDKVKEIYEDICIRLLKDKSECKQAVQIGNVQIEPSYKEQKKETIYESKSYPISEITVNYDVVITIKQIKFLGDLADQMTTIEGIVIDKVEGVQDEVISF